MKILKNIKVPTGNILVVQGDRGKLEVLSIGDYGKEQNVKADFLGLDREISGVPHGDLIPLDEKWVVTVSSQYGCSMGCTFCDVPNVGSGRNATLWDMQQQVISAISLHPEVKRTKRMNLHYARMGEPTFNSNVLGVTTLLGDYIHDTLGAFHPVVSTMMPLKNKDLKHFIRSWMVIKNHYMEGEAVLQISINSTDEGDRWKMFGQNNLSLSQIFEVMQGIQKPEGRKIALNFAVANYEIDAHKLLEYFDPEHYMCKLTPMHMTQSCEDNGISTEDGYDSFYPYQEAEYNLIQSGYDVIVFVPSKEEDQGRITCGNAILSGTMPTCEYEIVT